MTLYPVATIKTLFIQAQISALKFPWCNFSAEIFEFFLKKSSFSKKKAKKRQGWLPKLIIEGAFFIETNVGPGTGNQT